MRKFRLIMFLLSACFLTGCVTIVPVSTSEEAEPEVITPGAIQCADYVTENMLHVDYWLERAMNPDKVLMVQEEIDTYNKDLTYTDLASFSDTITGSALSEMVSKAEIPEGKCYVDGKEITKKYWAHVLANRNLEKIGDVAKVQKGCIVERADVREMPTDDIVTDDPADICYDMMQSTALLTNEPVLVLHESKDGKWYFIQSRTYQGFVKKDKVALIEDEKQWENIEKGDFLVVTGDKVRLEPNPYDSFSSEKEYSMGTKLPLATKEETPKRIGDRALYDNYIVKLPKRNPNGTLTYDYAMIPINRDVSVGYLPYTRENILRQVFKCLGNVYGWGGMRGARDCSSFSQEVYLCFGLKLPRNSSEQGAIKTNSVSFKGKNTEERQEILDYISPGAILYMPGHIMIYLGKVDGHYYVISASGKYVPAKEGKTGETVRTRSVSINDLNVGRADHTTWLDSLENAITVEKLDN